MRTKNPKTKSAPRLYNSPAIMDVFERIAAARLIQQRLCLTGMDPTDVSSPAVSPNRKLRELLLEVGSVAAVLSKTDFKHDPREDQFNIEDLGEALVHVAATAVAWLESLTPKKP